MIKEITKEMFPKLYNEAWYTIEGAGGNLDDWEKGYQDLLDQEGIGKVRKWVTYTGKDMNEWAQLTEDNAYPDNFTFISFSLDGLDLNKLAIFKLKMKDRWFNDIVDNNARREGYDPINNVREDEDLDESLTEDSDPYKNHIQYKVTFKDKEDSTYTEILEVPEYVLMQDTNFDAKEYFKDFYQVNDEDIIKVEKIGYYTDFAKVNPFKYTEEKSLKEEYNYVDDMTRKELKDEIDSIYYEAGKKSHTDITAIIEDPTVFNSDDSSEEGYFKDIPTERLKKVLKVLLKIKNGEKVNHDELNKLTESTIKQNGKWVNKGEDGTHGTFKTKKAADAQRKAMFAQGYKAEELEESYASKLSRRELEDTIWEILSRCIDASIADTFYMDSGLDPEFDSLDNLSDKKLRFIIDDLNQKGYFDEQFYIDQDNGIDWEPDKYIVRK